MKDPRGLAPYLRELEDLRRRLESFLDRAMTAREWTGGEEAALGSWSPAVDLVENGEEYLLLAELPGVDRSEIDLEVHGRRVVLSGRRAAPDGPRAQRSGGGAARARFHRMERSHGPFRRVFILDREVRADSVEAELVNGILRVRLPRAGAAAGTIPIDGNEPEEDGGR